MTFYPSVRVEVKYYTRSCRHILDLLATFSMDTCLNTFSNSYHVCPKCGHIWLETHVSTKNSSFNHHKWTTQMQHCKDHGDGSLLTPNDWHPDPHNYDSRLLLTRELSLPAFHLIYGAAA